MAEEKAASKKGELRRRHRALLEGGRVAALGSEGRLMLSYVLYWADFEKCTIRMSVRGAAKFLSVRPNSAQRGIRQLLDASVLMLLEKAEGGGRAVYELSLPQPEPVHEACAPRTRSVCAPHTRRVQSAHEAWTARTRSVDSAHTPRRRLQDIPIGNQFTNGEFNDDQTPDAAGEEPAARAQEGA
jgi:hypothetical protein